MPCRVGALDPFTLGDLEVTSYFISGASSGLGAELARQLVARGDSVAIAARRRDLLDALAAEIGGRVTVHALDVTNPEAVERVIREADQAHGGIDVVVVNAGHGGGKRIGTGRADDNRAVIETNLTGALSQIEVAMDLFRSRRRGHLVLVSSLASVRALPGSATVYSATKSALASIGESLRTELVDTPMTVTTLRPGYIRTDLTRKGRFPFMTPLQPGVAAMISAMDAKAGDVVVPAWPWRPLGWVLRLMPAGAIRRFT